MHNANSALPRSPAIASNGGAASCGTLSTALGARAYAHGAIVADLERRERLAQCGCVTASRVTAALAAYLAALEQEVDLGN